MTFCHTFFVKHNSIEYKTCLFISSIIFLSGTSRKIHFRHILILSYGRILPGTIQNKILSYHGSIFFKNKYVDIEWNHIRHIKIWSYGKIGNTDLSWSRITMFSHIGFVRHNSIGYRSYLFTSRIVYYWSIFVRHN